VARGRALKRGDDARGTGGPGVIGQGECFSRSRRNLSTAGRLRGERRGEGEGRRGGDELGRACNSRKLKDNRAEVTPIVTGSGSNGTADRTMLTQRDSLPPPYFSPLPYFM